MSFNGFEDSREVLAAKEAGDTLLRESRVAMVEAS